MERNKQQYACPFNEVKCPWCGKINDCSELLATGMLGDAVDEIIREEISLGGRGGLAGKSLTQLPKFDCDHCKRFVTVVKVDKRPRLLVRQYHGG